MHIKLREKKGIKALKSSQTYAVNLFAVNKVEGQ